MYFSMGPPAAGAPPPAGAPRPAAAQSPVGSASPGSPSAEGGASARSPLSSPRRASQAKLRVAIGCKDGLTISVAIASHLARQLSDRGFVATARHRELDRVVRRARKEAEAVAEGTEVADQSTAVLGSSP